MIQNTISLAFEVGNSGRAQLPDDGLEVPVGKAQLPDDGFDVKETDPFYCEGTVHTSLYHGAKLTV